MVEGWSIDRSQPVRPLMHKLALRILMQMVFGDRQDSRHARSRSGSRRKSGATSRAWKPWANLSRLQPRLRNLISSELEYRREPKDPDRQPDLLDYLLASRVRRRPGTQ